MKDYLAREDVSKERERVVDRLVVNGLVQVLDEDVSGSRTTSGRITVRPHDSDRLSVHQIEVHRVQSALG